MMPATPTGRRRQEAQTLSFILCYIVSLNPALLQENLSLTQKQDKANITWTKKVIKEPKRNYINPRYKILEPVGHFLFPYLPSEL